MKDEFRTESNKIINPPAQTPEPQKPTPITDNGGGTGSGGKTEKPITSINVKDLESATWGTTQSMKELQKQLSNYKNMLANATEQFTASKAQQGIDSTQRLIAAQPMALQMGISAEAAADLKDQTSALHDKVQEWLNEDPLVMEAVAKFDYLNGGKGLKQTAEDSEEVGKSMKFAASMTNTLSNALSSLEDPGAKVAATVAQAIASVALAYADTLAKDKTSKWNIFGFIAAAAAATVSMATTIASIHSATGYAEGGIIKGNSYSGDRIGGLVDGSQLVGLNAGELVLNKAQQANLAAELTGGGDGGGFASMPYVTGEKIVLGINNWAKRNGRGELVFSR